MILAHDIIQLIDLTTKKQEALDYLLSQLKDILRRNSQKEIDAYYVRKQKIDKGILKLDIEFLSVYTHLLSKGNIETFMEIPKEKYPELKKLKEKTERILMTEKSIQSLENKLMINGSTTSKHTAPRAIEAYKKFKK